MSSALDILKSVGAHGKNYLGFKHLSIGYHKIIRFRLVKNKMMRQDSTKPALPRVLLVELEDQVLYLPEYFAEKFNDDSTKIDELNNDGIVKYLFFGGQREHNK